MTPSPLPLEVLSRIFDKITNKGDLCSLSLASRALRDEGQRVLFRHPGTLRIELPGLPGNWFLDSIIASPHRLALVVRSFEAHLVWERRIERQGCIIDNFQTFLQRHKSDPKNIDDIVKFLDKLERALVLMINLKSLRIDATMNKDLSEATSPLTCILRRCTFQLHELYWRHVGSENELIISEFLPRQRALRSLDLPPEQLQHGTQYARTLQL